MKTIKHRTTTVIAVALTALLGQSAPVEDSAAGWQILPNETHPAMQLFRSGDFGNPFSGIFRKRLRPPAELTQNPAFKSIASYADGVPAVFEISDSSAPLLFFNLSLDPAHSDWTTQGSFLPAIAEILLRTRPSSKSESSHGIPGSRLSHVSSAQKGNLVERHRRSLFIRC